MRQDPRIIVGAELQVRVCSGVRSRTPVSPAVQKLLLLVIAVHEGETVALDQLASIAGISRETASMAVGALLDGGLLVRRDVRPNHPTSFPIARYGPKYAYWIAWAEIVKIARIDLTNRRVKSRCPQRAKV